MASEMFCVVDAHDRVIGAESRDYVHVNNLRHRAIHVLIFNLKGEIFLQRRSIWKDMHPGRWDSSTSGHVAPGESYEQAAHRELREEIGIDCQLEVDREVALFRCHRLGIHCGFSRQA